MGYKLILSLRPSGNSLVATVEGNYVKLENLKEGDMITAEVENIWRKEDG